MNLMKKNRNLFIAAVFLAAAGAGAEEIKIEGQTEPAARVEVPSVMRGVLAELNVKEGQAIKKGDIIALLDKELQELSVSIQKEKVVMNAEILFAGESFEHAKAEFEKYNKNPVVTQTEKDLKRIEMKRAEAYVKVKEEAHRVEELALKREELILKRMVIKSPIDGFIFRLPKSAGEAIDENQTAAVIVQTSTARANFFLPEIFFNKFKAGNKVTIELSTTPPIKREATIVTVDPYIDPAGHLFRVKMEIDNADGAVPVGVSAVWKINK